MKIKGWIVIFLLTCFGSSHACLAHDCGSENQFIEGNGILKTEMRAVAFFKEIDIAGAYTSTIDCGKKQVIKLTCDQNLLPHITTVVKNKKLYISNSSTLSTKNPLNIHVTVPDIVRVSSNGSSDITITDVDNQIISISLAGASQMKVCGITKAFEARLAGASKLHAKDLRSEDVSIAIVGAGNASVFADKLLNADITGAGSIVYYGNPAKISKQMLGVGRLIKRH